MGFIQLKLPKKNQTQKVAEHGKKKKSISISSILA
jgi:hypothetical protein